MRAKTGDGEESLAAGCAVGVSNKTDLEMIVLGIHGGFKRDDEDEPLAFAWHDSAAVLLRDGEILSAIEEERLDRIKHSNAFPARAMRHCLELGGVHIGDVDYIAINSAQEVVNARDRAALLEDPAAPIPTGNATTLSGLLHKALGCDVSAKVRFCHHHLAHAWSAYAPSGFADSLILSIDGEGDFSSGMVLVGRGGTLQPLRNFTVQQSLGHFYQQLIGFLGCQRFDEYKVMALASFGDKEVFASLFSKWYRLLPNGSYELVDRLRWFQDLNASGLLAQARRRDEPFTQLHKDFAAALQASLERIVTHVLTHYSKATGQTNLCLAGGVAHNCSVNGQILYSNLFRNVYVQPCAHDAGGALGAAWAVFSDGRPTRTPLKLNHLYLGTDVGSEAEIFRELEAWSQFIHIERSDDIALDAAKMLADGKVVGWVQGRSEFGPRALGNRSILADPRPAENKTLINAMVKKREQYRPFAPSVIEERAEDYFELPRNHASFPYMVVVLRVRKEMRGLLGAVTHVDGTARVQTVSKATNPLFWRLIDGFGALTGVSVLLNTSFNNNAEPIVDTVADAVTCLLTTGLNYLVIGPYIVTKRASTTVEFLSFVPELPLWRKLVRRRRRVDGIEQTVFEIGSTRSAFFGPVIAPISADVFALLELADGRKTASHLLDELNPAAGPDRDRIAQELFELWSARLVSLRPPVDGREAPR